MSTITSDVEPARGSPVVPRRRAVHTGARPKKTVWYRARFGLFNASALILGLYALFPVLWIFVTSIKPQSQLTAQPIVLIPTSITG
ncbi:MAG: hypothetical protein M0032_06260, partial [Actinomycetota bacterium]|nr:hypothetical protein [Actinomycetota bacterium]